MTALFLATLSENGDIALNSMYQIHANFHASPFYFSIAAVLSEMMDFFCPFTPNPEPVVILST
jgi:hypothetical protein